MSRWLNLGSFLSFSFSLYRPLGLFLGLWCLLVERFYGTTRTWTGKKGTTAEETPADEAPGTVERGKPAEEKPAEVTPADVQPREAPGLSEI